MRYVALDLETTGLNANKCQILEVGAVYDDGVSPISDLPTFSEIIHWDEIVGEPFALNMNAGLIEAIKDRRGSTITVALIRLGWWLDKCRVPRARMVTTSSQLRARTIVASIGRF